MRRLYHAVTLSDADTFDERSDDKGPEPEGLVMAEIDGRFVPCREYVVFCVDMLRLQNRRGCLWERSWSVAMERERARPTFGDAFGVAEAIHSFPLSACKRKGSGTIHSNSLQDCMQTCLGERG